MSAAIIVGAYALTALVAAPVIGRFLHRQSVRDFPTLYRDGYRAGDDWGFLAFFAASWPVSVPILWLMHRPRRARSDAPTRMQRMFFGGLS